MKPHLQKYPHIEVKQNFLRSALDELPELLERIGKRSVLPSIQKIRDMLLAYPLGLPSNPVALQRPCIHAADSAVCSTLVLIQNYFLSGVFDAEMYDNVSEMLETAHGYACKVIKIEATRPHHRCFEWGFSPN